MDAVTRSHADASFLPPRSFRLKGVSFRLKGVRLKRDSFKQRLYAERSATAVAEQVGSDADQLALAVEEAAARLSLPSPGVRPPFALSACYT